MWGEAVTILLAFPALATTVSDEPEPPLTANRVNGAPDALTGRGDGRGFLGMDLDNTMCGKGGSVCAQPSQRPSDGQKARAACFGRVGLWMPECRLSETWRSWVLWVRWRLSSPRAVGIGNKARLQRLSSYDVDGLAEALSKARKVIVMVGAGGSVSAGIPDFRSPGTGLYEQLGKYNLPHPEAMFDIDYFKRNPAPFYALCKELFPAHIRPTPTHYFFRLLHEKGKLLRVYTQNIDSLETLAGLPSSSVVAAHGNFDSASCVETGRPVDTSEVKEAILAGGTRLEELAKKYGGPVKPDIVFFGERLPERFFDLVLEDFPKCDLLIVVGTSLAIMPFASLIGRVGGHVPRVLVNRKCVGEARPLGPNAGEMDPGFVFDGQGRDACILGDCDATVWSLAEKMGWYDDLQRLVNASDIR